MHIYFNLVTIVFAVELIFYLVMIVPKYKYIGKRGHIFNVNHKHIAISVIYALATIAVFTVFQFVGIAPKQYIALIVNVIFVALPEVFEFFYLLDAKYDAIYPTYIDTVDDTDD